MKQLAALVAVLAMLGSGGAWAMAGGEGSTHWSRSKILATADAQAKRLGYDVEQMSVAFNFSNAQWRDYMKKVGYPKTMPKWLHDKLQNREVLAVYYAPMKKQLGGDLWIFLDWHTGEFVEALRGK